jgi:uncharacterized protein YxeA
MNQSIKRIFAIVIISICIYLLKNNNIEHFIYYVGKHNPNYVKNKYFVPYMPLFNSN